MTRRSAPPSRRCVANACRSRCGWRRSRRTVLVSRRRPADREEDGVVRARRRGRAGRAAGSARRAARPPRRAARRAPCRPFRARGRPRGRSRRRRGRARRPRRFAARRSRGARGARGCAARAASRRRRPRGSPRSRPASAHPGAGASGSVREQASGTDAGPKVKRRQERTAARRRAIDAGARRSRAAAELADPVGEDARVDVAEAELRARSSQSANERRSEPYARCVASESPPCCEKALDRRAACPRVGFGAGRSEPAAQRARRATPRARRGSAQRGSTGSAFPTARARGRQRRRRRSSHARWSTSRRSACGQRAERRDDEDDRAAHAGDSSLQSIRRHRELVAVDDRVRRRDRERSGEDARGRARTRSARPGRARSPSTSRARAAGRPGPGAVAGRTVTGTRREPGLRRTSRAAGRPGRSSAPALRR